MEKQEALEVEDFDQCKYIKQIIDKLKIVGNQLVSLEHQKREAIENEDYEKAKQLKF
jgi:centrosomal protein CEP104